MPGLPHNLPPGADTDISNDSSPRGYPDFPPSPDSWLGEPSSAHYWPSQREPRPLHVDVHQHPECFIPVSKCMCWCAQETVNFKLLLYIIVVLLRRWNWPGYSETEQAICDLFNVEYVFLFFVRTNLSKIVTRRP